MQLRDIMTHQVDNLPPGATLQEAARLMKSHDIGSVPVCDDSRLIGIITDRDIAVRAVAEGRDPKVTQVGDAMTQDLVFCYEDEDVEKCIQLMEERQIRRLPVLDRSQRLVGIVSLGDLATRHSDDQLSGEVLEQISQPNQPHV